MSNLAGCFKATLIKYRHRHPPCLFAGHRAVGEGRLAVCRDGGPKACGQTGWAQHVEFKMMGDAWKARRLRRAAWQDGQSSRRRATHPASLPGIMTMAILNQRCLKMAMLDYAALTQPTRSVFPSNSLLPAFLPFTQINHWNGSRPHHLRKDAVPMLQAIEARVFGIALQRLTNGLDRFGLSLRL